MHCLGLHENIAPQIPIVDYHFTSQNGNFDKFWGQCVGVVVVVVGGGGGGCLLLLWLLWLLLVLLLLLLLWLLLLWLFKPIFF